MNRKTWVGALAVCLSFAALQSEPNQFIKDRRTKKVSTARMKEDLGGLLGQSLLHSSEIIERIGKLQKELMQMTATLIEQPKESKLTQADRFALDKTLEKIAAIECDLAGASKRLAQQIEMVKNQY